MTDELDRLARAFEADAPPPPDPARRAATLAAARAAHAGAGGSEKISRASQERASGARLREGRASGPGDRLRRLAMTTSRALTARGALIGTTSAAALALAIFATANLERHAEIERVSPPAGETPAPKAEAEPEPRAEAAPETLPEPAEPAPAALADLAEAEPPEPAARAADEAEARPPALMALQPSPPPAAGAPTGSASEADLLERFQGQQTRGLAAARAPSPEMRTRMMARGLAAPLAEEAPAPGYRDQGRDRFEAVDDNPVKLAAEEPVSTFSIDVDTASYSVMRKALEQGVLPQKDAIRVEELVNYFAYDYAPPEGPEPPFATHVSVFETPWNPDTRLLRIGLKGYELAPEERPTANLVFLIDTSGSMNAPDKLPLLRNAFRLLLDRLEARDRVAIVTYAGSAGTVLEPTPASEKAKILAALDRLSAGGSTAGGEGIRQAYALAEANLDPDGVNRVILATDGDFNVGIRSTEELQGFVERKRETGVLLSVLGFGRGNYNDALMQALAQNGNGQAAFIDTLSEARKVLGEEASGTLFPIAQDVKIQVEFNPATVAEYRLIGYETRALAREDFNNDKVDAGEIGSGHRVTALYEITPVGSPARLVDDLRYGAPEAAPREAAQAGPDGPAPEARSDEAAQAAEEAAQAAEFAFLRIRYKRPGETESRLIERPIAPADAGTPGREARFAAAVAGFGQLLRGGAHTGDWSYADAIALANGAKGPDPYGYRAEFVQLVRLAETAARLERQR